MEWFDERFLEFFYVRRFLEERGITFLSKKDIRITWKEAILLSINSYEQKSGQWYRLIERELDYILK